MNRRFARFWVIRKKKAPSAKGTRLNLPVVPPNFASCATTRSKAFDTITGRPSPPTYQRGSSGVNFPRTARAEFQPRSALSAGRAFAGIVSIFAFQAYYTGFFPISQDKKCRFREKSEISSRKRASFTESCQDRRSNKTLPGRGIRRRRTAAGRSPRFPHPRLPPMRQRAPACVTQNRR